MYERRHHPLASREVYRRRLLNSGTFGLGVVALSLAIGMAGYMAFENLGALDAFLDASMILAGMGPVHMPVTAAGKLFAGIYALYSGFAVLGIAAIMLAPVVHRVLHRFHLEEEGEQPKAPKQSNSRRR